MDVTREHIPVTCSPDEDINSTMNVLQDAPQSLSRCRFHIIHHLNRRMLFLGSLGLMGGGNGHTNTPDEAEPIRTLKDLLLTKPITTTEELIDAVNGWEDDEKREQLFEETMVAFTVMFGRNRLTGWTLPQLMEYASLNELKASTTDAKNTMRSRWLSELTNKAAEERGDELFMKALNLALQNLDVEIFEDDPSSLIDLAGVLIEKLNPKTNVFIKASAPKKCDILCALHRIFQLVCYVNPVDWDMSKTKGLFPNFIMKVKEIIHASADCFILRHHAKLVQQSIIQLGSEASARFVRRLPLEIWKTIQIASNVWQGLRSILVLRFETDTFEKAHNLNKELSDRSEQEKWFLWLQSLQGIALDLIEDAKSLKHYQESLKIVLSKMPDLPMEERKHLRYGIIEQLTMLTLMAIPEEVRKETSEILIELTTHQDGGDSLSEDPEIIEFENECRGLISGQAMLNEVSPVGTGNFSSSSLSSLSQSLTNSMTSSSQGLQRYRLESLFIMVRNNILSSQVNDYDIRRVFSSSEEMIEMIKSTHKEHLKFITSFDEQKKDVSMMEFDLKDRRADDRLSSVGSSDISSASSSGRGPPKSDEETGINLDVLFPINQNMSRILVKGMPGVGKSALMNRLAVDWSEGKWGLQFRAVFVLPITGPHTKERDSSDEAEKPTLAQDIAKYYATIMNNPSLFQDLLQFIQEALKDPRTLVILDGVHGAKGEGKSPVDGIINQAEAGQHRLLVLSRPDIGDVKDLDRIFELCPLSATEVLLRLADSFIQSQVRACPNLLEVVRNPLHLEILTSKEQSLEEASGNISRSEASCFRKIVVNLWKLHEERGRLSKVSRDEAFLDLGRIAIRGLMHGRSRIPVPDQEVDIEYLVSKSNLVDRSLLVRHSNGDVEFSDNILQQYFVGHLLSKWLFEDKDNEAKATSWIQKERYNVKYATVLKVMSGIFAKENKTEEIRKLLSTVDKGQVDRLGVHHLSVKMKILQEWLLENKDLSANNAIDKSFKVSTTLGTMLKKALKATRKKTMADVTMLEAIIRIMAVSPDVVAQKKSELISLVVKELQEKQEWDVEDTVIKALAVIVDAGDDNGEIWMDALKTGLGHSSDKIQRLVVKHVGLMGQFSKKSIPRLLELLLECPQSKARDIRVVELIRRAPELVGNYVEDLLLLCNTKDYWVRWSIIEAIPDIIRNNSSSANCLMVKLLEACMDNPRTVSAGVIDILGICFQHHRSYVNDIDKSLLTAWKGMGEDQRNATGKAFVRVIHSVPEKAIEIMDSLLNDEKDASWPSAYPIAKTVLEAFEAIPPEDVDKIVSRMKSLYKDKEDRHSMALLLEAVQHMSKASSRSLRDLIPIVLSAFKHKEWTMRHLAYCAVGAIAKDGPSHLTDKLVKGFIEACKHEEVWKAQCGAFEAASYLLGANAELRDLLSVCHDALGNSDDVIRKLAGQAVMHVAFERFKHGDRVIDDLVSSYQEAKDDDIKHGIVHCLHLIVQRFPDTMSAIISILVEAAGSPNSMIASVGVSGLKTATDLKQTDMQELISPLMDACRRQERNICFCALDALVTCTIEDQNHRKHLVESLKAIPDPLNDQEWLMYLHALEVAVRHPQDDAKELLDVLLTKAEDTPPVLKTRKEIIDSLSLVQLLQWHEFLPIDSVLHQIFRRLFQLPCIFDNTKKRGEKSSIQVYSENGPISHFLNDELKKKLNKYIKHTWQHPSRYKNILSVISKRISGHWS